MNNNDLPHAAEAALPPANRSAGWKLIQRFLNLFRKRPLGIIYERGRIYYDKSGNVHVTGWKVDGLGRAAFLEISDQYYIVGYPTGVKPNAKFSRADDGSSPVTKTLSALAETPCSAVSEGGRS